MPRVIAFEFRQLEGPEFLAELSEVGIDPDVAWFLGVFSQNQPELVRHWVLDRNLFRLRSRKALATRLPGLPLRLCGEPLPFLPKLPPLRQVFEIDPRGEPETYNAIRQVLDIGIDYQKPPVYLPLLKTTYDFNPDSHSFILWLVPGEH